MKINNAKDVGFALKSMRLASDRKQQDVARVAGITPSFLCHIEAGRRLPSPTLLLHLVKELGGHIEIHD